MPQQDAFGGVVLKQESRKQDPFGGTIVEEREPSDSFPKPEGGTLTRFGRGVIAPVAGMYEELKTYLTDPKKWREQYRSAGAFGDRPMPGSSIAPQIASGDIAGLAGTAVGQLGMLATGAKLAGPRMLTEPKPSISLRAGEMSQGVKAAAKNVNLPAVAGVAADVAEVAGPLPVRVGVKLARKAGKGLFGPQLKPLPKVGIPRAPLYVKITTAEELKTLETAVREAAEKGGYDTAPIAGMNAGQLQGMHKALTGELWKGADVPKAPPPFRPNPQIAKEIEFGGARKPDYSKPAGPPRRTGINRALEPKEPETSPKAPEPYKPKPEILRLIQGHPSKEKYSKPAGPLQRRGINRAMEPAEPTVTGPEGPQPPEASAWDPTRGRTWNELKHSIETGSGYSKADMEALQGARQQWNDLNRAVHASAEAMGMSHENLSNAAKAAGRGTVADLSHEELKGFYEIINKEPWQGGPEPPAIKGAPIKELKQAYEKATGKKWEEIVPPSRSKPRPVPREPSGPPAKLRVRRRKTGQ